MISINEMKVSAYYMISNKDTVEDSAILTTSEQEEEDSCLSLFVLIAFQVGRRPTWKAITCSVISYKLFPKLHGSM